MAVPLSGDTQRSSFLRDLELGGPKPVGCRKVCVTLACTVLNWQLPPAALCLCCPR